jgi:hypothetical protein
MNLNFSQATAIDVLTSIPRFGRSSNFADIWGTQDEKREYILGLVFWGILLFSLCFLWSISIIIWKWLGRQKVGFLSGAPFIRPQAALSIRHDRSFWYRLVFLNAALLFIVCEILFVTQGITNLRTTLNTFIYSTEVRQRIFPFLFHLSPSDVFETLESNHVERRFSMS